MVKDVHVEADSSSSQDIDHACSTCTLAAHWASSGSGQNPLRYDWSVGEDGLGPGDGLLDTENGPVWMDSGTDMKAIFTVDRSKGKFL